jgi:hypothetical protein
VVHADAVADELAQRLAEAGGEPEPADLELGDLVLLRPGEEVRTLISDWARSTAPTPG